MIDYAQLTIEIQTDPAGLGYAASVTAGADGTIANLMNALGAGSVNQPALLASVIIGALDPTEFAALTQVQLMRLQIILSAGTVNLSNANTRNALAAIFPSGGPTRTNVAALVQRSGSRAEVLFGTGTQIRPDDVSKALQALRG